MATVTIPANVSEIVKCCSSDASALFTAIVGVKIEATEKSYRVIATDGKQLAMVTGPTPESKNQLSKDDFGNPVDNAVIPKKDFAAIFGSKTITIDEDGDQIEVDERRPAVIGMGSKRSLLSSPLDDDGYHTREVKNLEGRYPSVDSVIPKSAPDIVALVDAKKLATLLEVAASIQGDQGTILEIRNGEMKTIVLRAKNEDTEQEMTGILMQLT